jgi:hypothetical protein
LLSCSVTTTTRGHDDRAVFEAVAGHGNRILAQ